MIILKDISRELEYKWWRDAPYEYQRAKEQGACPLLQESVDGEVYRKIDTK